MAEETQGGNKMTESPQYEYEEMLKALSMLIHDTLTKAREVNISKYRAMCNITKLVNNEFEEFDDEN